MRRNQSSKSALFLIEMIIVILFFSLAGATCIQLFVQAHLRSTLSREVSTAMNLAQAVAEEFKADPLGTAQGETVLRHYDKAGIPLWGLQAEEEAVYYSLLAEYDTTAQPARVEITVLNPNREPVFSMAAAKYIPQ